MVTKLICAECGFMFYGHEAARYVERHGFEHGPFEEFYACPFCGGAYDEADDDINGNIHDLR